MQKDIRKAQSHLRKRKKRDIKRSNIRKYNTPQGVSIETLAHQMGFYNGPVETPMYSPPKHTRKGYASQNREAVKRRRRHARSKKR